MNEYEDGVEINNAFPDQLEFATSHHFIPQFVDFSNYLASDLVLSDLSFYQQKKLMSDVKKIFWDSLTCYVFLLVGLFDVVYQS